MRCAPTTGGALGPRPALPSSPPRGAATWQVRTYDGQRNDDDLRQPVFANASKRELSTIPGADPPGTPYHSILVEKGGRVKRHREFVCMHSDQTYPEYLIAFTREWVDPP
jgi:hypothetical protein